MDATFPLPGEEHSPGEDSTSSPLRQVPSRCRAHHFIRGPALLPVDLGLAEKPGPRERGRRAKDGLGRAAPRRVRHGRAPQHSARPQPVPAPRTCRTRVLVRGSAAPRPIQRGRLEIARRSDRRPPHNTPAQRPSHHPGALTEWRRPGPAAQTIVAAAHSSAAALPVWPRTGSGPQGMGHRLRAAGRRPESRGPRASWVGSPATRRSGLPDGRARHECCMMSANRRLAPGSRRST